MDYGQIFGDIGKFAVGTTVIGFVAKSLLSQFLSRDLESYKAKLLAEHNREIERLKAEIRLAAFEHETRFVRLHEKRVEVIAELYKLLSRTTDAFQAWVAIFSVAQPTMSEKQKLAEESANSFFVFFEENQIYLDVELCALIVKLRDGLRHTWAHFNNAATNSKPSPEEWLRVWEGFQHAVPPLRIEIEKRVRQMLGVIEES